VCGTLLRAVSSFETEALFLDAMTELPNTCAKTLTMLNRQFQTPTLRPFALQCAPIDEFVVQNWFQRTFSVFSEHGDVALVSSSSKSAAGDGSSSSSSSASGKLPLQGQVAIVLGASSGIGQAIAIRLAAAGARVVCAARRVQRLAETVATITAASGKGVAVACAADVTRFEQVAQCVNMAKQAFGQEPRPNNNPDDAKEAFGVDILVNSSGLMPYHYMATCDVEEWSQMVDVNCKGVLHGIAAVLPGMRRRKTGNIVNISSDAGRKVFAGLSVYSATKHFVEAVSRGLRQEVADCGIRVCCVQPGDVRTDLNKTTTDLEALKQAEYLSDPDTKILDVEHIADLVVFTLQQPAHVAINEVLIEPTMFPI
jgi:NADP-dependent 3-hydroxy acid dehydrogenase YdfG